MSKPSIPNILGNLWFVTTAVTVLVLSLFALVFWPREIPRDEKLAAVQNKITARVTLQRGYNLHRQLRFPAAIARYSESIEAMPDQERAYFLRGSAKVSRGLLEEALEDLTKSVSFSDYFYQAYNSLGVLKFQLGDTAGAEEAFTRSIAGRPDFARPFLNRGLAKRSRGDLEGAMADFNTAVEINGSCWAHDCRGALRYAQGDLDGAFEDFEATHARANYQFYSNGFLNSAAMKKQRGDNAGAAEDMARYQEVEKLIHERNVRWKPPRPAAPKQ